MGKFIIINDCTKDELKTILNDWLVMYADKLKSKSVFEFAEIRPNRFLLKIDKNIDDTYFFYLVNYFAFPVDFEKTFEVTGYATASKHKKILNKNIYIFINKQDNEFDNVWITTEDDETYKFDFGGKLIKISESNFKYIEPNTGDSHVSYEQIIIDKKELLEEAKEIESAQAERRLEKRFKIISNILFIGIPIVFLIKQITQYFTDIGLVYFFASVIYLWFFMDYKIFHNLRRTLICVLLSLLFIIFGVNTKNVFFATISTVSMSSIIVMSLVHIFWGAKVDDIMTNRRFAFFWVMLIVFSFLISKIVFYPILKQIME